MGANAPYYENNKVDDVDYISAADLEAIESGFSDVDTDKADKVAPAAAGNIATLSAAGNLQDGGVGLPSGALVGTTDAQVLTDKTLNSAALDSPNITTGWSIGGTAVTATADELNILDGVTATTAELNILDGVTATAAELNFVDGVTSNIQTQLDAKQAAATAVTLTGAQSLEDKTLIAPSITAQTGVKVSMAASNIDLSAGDVFTKTITGTTTLTVSNVPSTGKTISFVLELTNGGSYTVNWFSGIQWEGGTEPDLTASGKDALQFYTYDGGATWVGQLSVRGAAAA